LLIHNISPRRIFVVAGLLAAFRLTDARSASLSGLGLDPYLLDVSGFEIKPAADGTILPMNGSHDQAM
jgi:hypothetical protein